MKVEMLYEEDGMPNTVMSVPNVKWYDEFLDHSGVLQPGSLYVMEKDVVRHIEAVNENRRKYGLKERVVDMSRLVCAEAPVEIYCDSEQAEPWKHYGLLKRKVPAANYPFGID